MISASPSRGIAIVAIDKVMHWLLAFLESRRTTSTHLPVHLIPFDKKVELTRHGAQAHGSTIADVDAATLDALSKGLDLLGWYKRKRLHRPGVSRSGNLAFDGLCSARYDAAAMRRTRALGFYP